MFPSWSLFEPQIRAMAGLGAVDVGRTEPAVAEQINRACDLLVVGGGPAGLAAARAAAEQGLSVVLCDERDRFGGSLLYRQARIDGLDGRAWVEATLARLRALGALTLPATTAFGVYDHRLVGLNQRGEPGAPDRLWRVRAARLALATGAIERPLPFANNDLPGVMSAEAALAYLRRYGVAVGRKVVVATNNGFARETAEALAAAGADVTLVDSRPGADETRDGVRALCGRSVVRARGRRGVAAATLSDGAELPADALLVSGGFTPTVHLYSQARGKLAWSDDIAAFAPGAAIDGVAVVGAANGDFALSRALAGAVAAVGGADSPKSDSPDRTLAIMAAWARPQTPGRVWIDLQSDVTAGDVELAAREAYASVEHVKRYTTLGMATDQGKTANLNGLALLAQATNRAIPEVGTTTYRPPFTPVPFTSFAGSRFGALMNPLRRLPLEAEHRADGAVFQEYGGWLRPAYYGPGDVEAASAREAKQARETVALFDGSTLGKIEVIGPDAALFLDFIYYNAMATLKPGRCRYGFMLTETGVVYDDGVLARLDDNRFIVSCSSSHVAGVHAALEEWRQDRFDRRRVFIHNATAEMATLTVSGPKSRDLLQDVGLSGDDLALPHMAVSESRLGDLPLRVARVSYTGDRSYELSAPADRAGPLWARLKAAGRAHGATLLGVEALMILRAEKGYIVVGKDTDGASRPVDFGADTPLLKKSVEFVGRRSLLMDEAQRADRPQFVGLEAADGLGQLPPGAHAYEMKGGRARSLGFVTSSYLSPTLQRPIALGLIERGRDRLGETVDLHHLGQLRKARIAPPCAFDPQGERLHA